MTPAHEPRGAQRGRREAEGPFFGSREPQGSLRDPIRPTRHTFWAMLLFAAVLAGLWFGWPELAHREWDAIFQGPRWYERMDWLLFGIFLFFTFCFSLDPSARHDLPTVAAGLFGGAVIEYWGTRTGLWYYYTGERPPLWILPAWGASALANEKLLRLFLVAVPPQWRERIITDRRGRRRERLGYLLLASVIFCFFLYWSRHVFWHPVNLAVTAMIFAVMILSAEFPAYVLSLYFVSAAFGVFIEIWGTTRHCWNYYDGHAPSPFPIVGHGFAAVAFWRFKEVVRWAWEKRK